MKQYLQIKKIALAVAFSFTSLIGFAQAPAIQWDKTFGGDSPDQLKTITNTSDGGFILSGWALSGTSGDKSDNSKGMADYWIVKLDASGSKQWDKTFGGNNEDLFPNVVQTTDGGYLIGGSSYSGLSGDKTEPNRTPGTVLKMDYWILKLDANGNKHWDKTFGGSGDDGLTTLQQTMDGGYILGGYSVSGISGDKTEASKGDGDYWIVKIDAAGNKQWDKTLGGNLSDYPSKVQQTTDGGYILAGASVSDISGDKSESNKGDTIYIRHYDYWVVKTDSNGNKLWDKTIGGSFMEDLRDMVITSDGGFLLGGFSNSGISGNKTEICKGGADFWVVKLNSNGNQLWDKTIGGNHNDRLYNVKQTIDGGFILGGNSLSEISIDKTDSVRGDNDFWIVKIDGSGNMLWDKTIGGDTTEFMGSILQTLDGGYIIGGTSESGISGEKATANRGFDDYWIVKLAPEATTGISKQINSLNLSISPNPSQGKFQLQLNNLTAKTAAITVSDLVGRIVYQQEIPVTGNQMQQEIKLPAVKGMYMLQVKAGAQTTTNKIVIE